MGFRFKFLMLVVAAGIVSTLLHELGHCVFYWLQGIPAGMSLVKEYPLIDITAHQYGIGSAGGPLINIILILLSCLLLLRYKKRTKAWNLLSAFVLANAFYFIIRSLEALLKGEGGEIQSAAELVRLNYFFVVALFSIITLTVLILWICKFEIRMSIRNAGYFLLLFITFVTVISVIHAIDSNLFWQRFPAIKIDDGRVYNQIR